MTTNKSKDQSKQFEVKKKIIVKFSNDFDREKTGKNDETIPTLGTIPTIVYTGIL